MFHVRGLTKVYGSGTAEVRALAGVDLDLNAGELVVLLGPSGSGKTTLLNQLGGLDIPTTGTLRYRDIDLTHRPQYSRGGTVSKGWRVPVEGPGLSPITGPEGTIERGPTTGRLGTGVGIT